jgi:CCR4-NOT transcription complex subunit 3
MATNRKLQGEIERVLKKVNEGIIEFEGFLKKVYNANSNNQKEKHENDMKKEIKKLQRLREQIKSWVSSNEIKNKSPLVDARKRIEAEMEKFKNYEKESKTKAYSKEGLLNARENAKKEDPKGEIRQWTQKMIDELKIQIDDFEMKKEAINAKKNPSAQELEHYSKSLTRHNFHLLCLEKMLRMWENDNISREEIEEIKDNVEYYVENNQEPDFIEDETIYDSFKDMLGLDGIPEEGDEFDLDLDDNSNESEDKSDDENGEKNDRKGLTTSSNTVSSTSSNNTNESIKSMDKHKTEETENKSRSSSTTPAPITATPTPASSKTAVATTTKASPNSLADLARAQLPTNEKTTPAPVVTPKTAPTVPVAKTTPSPTPVVEDKSKKTAAPTPVTVTQTSPQTSLSSSSASVDALTTSGKTSAMSPQAMLELSFDNIPEPQDSYGYPRRYNTNATAASSGMSKNGNIPTPPYYPTTVAPYFDNAALYEKFDMDTLFFIFYYQQGTYQQYLAAKELKRQYWRYHKKYLTWFQRHEEPTEITPEYEQGTYVYFDYETGWCQRKKSEFKFEYKYLEDLKLDFN